jgi:hypothetical protein
VVACRAAMSASAAFGRAFHSSSCQRASRGP